MTIAADLYSLQEIDLALNRALARLEEIEEGIKESEELMQARQTKEEKERVLAGFRSKQQELEWAVDEIRAKASEVEAKLYSGRVTSAKELTDLDADLRSLKTQTSKREDSLLALLVEADEAEGEVRGATGKYESIEAEWTANRDSLLAEKAQLGPEVERLRAARARGAADIERSALSLYEVLRSRRGGQAVATVERGMCEGCRITLPMSILSRARSGVGLVQCVSCERVLLVS